MIDPTYANVIEQFFKEALDPILHVFVYDGYTTFAEHLKAPLGTAVVLYIVLLGISISQGWIKLSMAEFVKSAIKIGLVYTFAMHWGEFSHFVVDGIQNSASQISSWYVSATPIHLPQFAGTGIEGAMQSILIEFTKLGAWIWGKGSWDAKGAYFTALMIWGFGYAVILIGLLEIVAAKIMLAILFTSAPLFISFTLFKPTQSFFDRWLGAITGFAFLLIFVSAAMALALSFAQWAIGGMFINQFINHTVHIELMSCVPTIVVGFVGVGMMYKVASMAQSIGGAVSTASGAEMFASAVGGFMGGAMGSRKMMSHGFSAAKGALSGLGKLMKQRNFKKQPLSKDSK